MPRFSKCPIDGLSSGQGQGADGSDGYHSAPGSEPSWSHITHVSQFPGIAFLFCYPKHRSKHNPAGKWVVAVPLAVTMAWQ